VSKSAHGDPFALNDEYVYHQRSQPGDQWQQLHTDLRSDIAFRRHMRDAQVEGDDLYTEYQNEITFMTRQLLALEENIDRLRDAQGAVTRAERHRIDCRYEYQRFGARCGGWRNAVGGIGAVAIILWSTLGDVPGFIIALAVLGPLAAAGLHALGVMGGGGRAAKADRADDEWHARAAELQHLKEQVLRGVRNPQPLSHQPSDHQPGTERQAAPSEPSTMSLFPKQATNSGTDQSAAG
jgi:hypothetical protein